MGNADGWICAGYVLINLAFTITPPKGRNPLCLFVYVTVVLGVSSGSAITVTRRRTRLS
jgi:hypothetical protein